MTNWKHVKYFFFYFVFWYIAYYCWIKNTCSGCYNCCWWWLCCCCCCGGGCVVVVVVGGGGVGGGEDDHDGDNDVVVVVLLIEFLFLVVYQINCFLFRIGLITLLNWLCVESMTYIYITLEFHLRVCVVHYNLQQMKWAMLKLACVKNLVVPFRYAY